MINDVEPFFGCNYSIRMFSVCCDLSSCDEKKSETILLLEKTFVQSFSRDERQTFGDFITHSQDILLLRKDR